MTASDSELKRLRKSARDAKKRVRALKDELKSARKSARKARKQLRKASAVQQRARRSSRTARTAVSARSKPKPAASSAKKPAKTATAWKKRRIRNTKGVMKAAALEPASSATDANANAGASSLGSVEALIPNVRSGIE